MVNNFTKVILISKITKFLAINERTKSSYNLLASNEPQCEASSLHP